MGTDSHSRVCGQCEDRVAVIECGNCVEVFCDPCSKAFHRKGRMKEHKLVKMGSESSSPSVTCPYHGQLLQYFCRVDSQLICASCLLNEGDAHHNHDYLKLEDAHTRNLEVVEKHLKMLQEKEKRFGELLDEYTDHEENAFTYFEGLRKTLPVEFDDVRLSVEECYDGLVDGIFQSENDAISILHHQRDPVEKVFSAIARAVGLCERAMKHKDDPIYFLSLFRDIEEAVAFEKQTYAEPRPVLNFKHSHLPDFSLLKRVLKGLSLSSSNEPGIGIFTAHNGAFCGVSSFSPGNTFENLRVEDDRYWSADDGAEEGWVCVAFDSVSMLSKLVVKNRYSTAVQVFAKEQFMDKWEQVGSLHHDLDGTPDSQPNAHRTSGSFLPHEVTEVELSHAHAQYLKVVVHGKGGTAPSLCWMRVYASLASE